MMSKIWVGMFTTHFHLFQFKIKSQLQNVDFVIMPVHQNLHLNLLKGLTLHSSFWLFLIKYFHWIAILSALESASLDKSVRCASKWFILRLRTRNLEFVSLNFKHDKFLCIVILDQGTNSRVKICKEIV